MLLLYSISSVAPTVQFLPDTCHPMCPMQPCPPRGSGPPLPPSLVAAPLPPKPQPAAKLLHPLNRLLPCQAPSCHAWGCKCCPLRSLSWHYSGWANAQLCTVPGVGVSTQRAEPHWDCRAGGTTLHSTCSGALQLLMPGPISNEAATYCLDSVGHRHLARNPSPGPICLCCSRMPLSTHL